MGVQIFSSDCPPMGEDGEGPEDKGGGWLTEKPGRNFEAVSVDQVRTP